MSENQTNDFSQLDGLSKVVTNSLSQLPFTHLISEPLKACVHAQNETTKATLASMMEMGLIADKNKNKAAIFVEFEFMSGGRIKKMSVPLLTLVPINFIGINSVTIAFKAAINASSKNTFADIGAEIAKAKKDSAKKDESEGGSGGENNNTNEPPKKSVRANAKKNKSSSGEETTTEENDSSTPDNQTSGSDDKDGDKGFDWDILKNVPKVVEYVIDLIPSKKDEKAKDKENGSNYSNKKDSTSTRESKYSIETTVDFSLSAGPTDMPGGMARMLEILNSTIEVFDPDGELLITEYKIGKGEKVYIEYKNEKGLYEIEEIKINNSQDVSVPKEKIEEMGNGILVQLDDAGNYTVTAKKKKEVIIVTE